MQISSTRRNINTRKNSPKIKSSLPSPSGIKDSIADGFQGLPRWPKAAVAGAATFAPASIGAMIGNQFGGVLGRVAGAAVGGAVSYLFQTAIADTYSNQAKMTAGLATLAAAIQPNAGISLIGVGKSVAWSAGIGVAQEAFMRRY